MTVKVSLQFWKTGYLDVTKQKKNICCTYHSFPYNCGSKLQQVPSIFTFLHITFAVLQKPCQENFRKFQEFGKSRFGSSEKDCYFFKILKWQHKLVWEYKGGKLVSYFVNNAAKTCLYELKVSENIEIEHAFQSKAFFFCLSGNLYTSCFSAFKMLTFSN